MRLKMSKQIIFSYKDLKGVNIPYDNVVVISIMITNLEV